MWGVLSENALAGALASALGVSPASRVALSAASPTQAPGAATSSLAGSMSVSGFGDDADAAQAVFASLQTLYGNASVSTLPGDAASAFAGIAASSPSASVSSVTLSADLRCSSASTLHATVAVVVTVPPSANLTATAESLQAGADAPASLLPGLASCGGSDDLSATGSSASNPAVMAAPPRSLLASLAVTGAAALPAAAAAGLGALGLVACCVAVCCVVARKRRTTRVAAFLASSAARASEAEGKAAAAARELTRAEAVLSHAGAAGAAPSGSAPHDNKATTNPLFGGAAASDWPPPPPPPAAGSLFFGPELASLERALAWGEARAASAQEALIHAATRLKDTAMRRVSAAAPGAHDPSDPQAKRAPNSSPDRRTARRASSSAAMEPFGGGVNPLWAPSDERAAPAPSPDAAPHPRHPIRANAAAEPFIEGEAAAGEAEAAVRPGRRSSAGGGPGARKWVAPITDADAAHLAATAVSALQQPSGGGRRGARASRLRTEAEADEAVSLSVVATPRGAEAASSGGAGVGGGAPSPSGEPPRRRSSMLLRADSPR